MYLSETKALNFVKNHLTEGEFQRLKFKVSETNESKVNIGDFRFYITRNRMGGKDIVSYISKKENEKNGLIPGFLNIFVADTSPKHQGYFNRKKL